MLKINWPQNTQIEDIEFFNQIEWDWPPYEVRQTKQEKRKEFSHENKRPKSKL